MMTIMTTNRNDRGERKKPPEKLSLFNSDGPRIDMRGAMVAPLMTGRPCYIAEIMTIDETR